MIYIYLPSISLRNIAATPKMISDGLLTSNPTLVIKVWLSYSGYLHETIIALTINIDSRFLGSCS